jgi:hypothetical protein
LGGCERWNIRVRYSTLLSAYVVTYFCMSSEMLVPTYQNTRRRIPEHRHPYTTLRGTNHENEKSKMFGKNGIWSEAEVCNLNTEKATPICLTAGLNDPSSALPADLGSFRPRTEECLQSYEWARLSTRTVSFAWSNSPPFADVAASLPRPSKPATQIQLRSQYRIFQLLL